jgi:hypothetical protein
MMSGMILLVCVVFFVVGTSLVVIATEAAP